MHDVYARLINLSLVLTRVYYLAICFSFSVYISYKKDLQQNQWRPFILFASCLASLSIDGASHHTTCSPNVEMSG